jgi:hypothetical protein
VSKSKNESDAGGGGGGGVMMVRAIFRFQIERRDRSSQRN